MSGMYVCNARARTRSLIDAHWCAMRVRFMVSYSFPERCKDERGLLTEGAFISKIVATQGLGDQHSLVSGEIWLIFKGKLIKI